VEAGEVGIWHGRRVCLLDGSTLRLPAESSLSAHYGVPKGKWGVGHWPTLRVVAGFDLWSGAVEAVEEGPYRESEIALALRLVRRILLDAFSWVTATSDCIIYFRYWIISARISWPG